MLKPWIRAKLRRLLGLRDDSVDCLDNGISYNGKAHRNRRRFFEAMFGDRLEKVEFCGNNATVTLKKGRQIRYSRIGDSWIGTEYIK